MRSKWLQHCKHVLSYTNNPTRTFFVITFNFINMVFYYCLFVIVVVILCTGTGLFQLFVLIYSTVFLEIYKEKNFAKINDKMCILYTFGKLSKCILPTKAKNFKSYQFLSSPKQRQKARTIDKIQWKSGKNKNMLQFFFINSTDVCYCCRQKSAIFHFFFGNRWHVLCWSRFVIYNSMIFGCLYL